MVRFVLLLHDFGKRRVEVIRLLRTVLGLGIKEIKDAPQSGEPLLDVELFDRNRPSRSREILELLASLDSFGASYSAFEVPGEQQYSKEGRYFELNFDRLARIIQSREDSIAEQRFPG